MHLSHLFLRLTKLPMNHCALFIRSAAALPMLFTVLRLYYTPETHPPLAGKTFRNIPFLGGRFELSKCVFNE